MWFASFRIFPRIRRNPIQLLLHRIEYPRLVITVRPNLVVSGVFNSKIWLFLHWLPSGNAGFRPAKICHQLKLPRPDCWQVTLSERVNEFLERAAFFKAHFRLYFARFCLKARFLPEINCHICLKMFHLKRLIHFLTSFGGLSSHLSKPVSPEFEIDLRSIGQKQQRATYFQRRWCEIQNIQQK